MSGRHSSRPGTATSSVDPYSVSVCGLPWTRLGSVTGVDREGVFFSVQGGVTPLKMTPRRSLVGFNTGVITLLYSSISQDVGSPLGRWVSAPYLYSEVLPSFSTLRPRVPESPGFRHGPRRLLRAVLPCTPTQRLLSPRKPVSSSSVKDLYRDRVVGVGPSD